ncbi:MAG: S41 family peptidase, partial [Pseudomonadota bacterium]
ESADTDYIAHSLLEFRFPDLLWLIEPDIETFDLVLESMEGIRKLASVPALSSDQQRANQTESAGFQLSSNARESRLLENGIAYLRPGPFYNYTDPDRTWDNSSFITFIDDAFESFLSAGSDTLVIDLRQNPGGDNSFSDHMVSWIADEPFVFASEFLIRSSDEAEAANQARLDGNPGAAEGVSGLFAKEYKSTPRGETFSFKLPPAQPRTGVKFEGDVFVLINRHSYSQAVNVAATFQDYGWGTIVGEPTSDFATTYGSIETFTLPNTGLTVNFPKAHIIRPSGDRVPGGVVPDIEIASPIVPVKEDVVLDELISRIAD